MLLRRRTVRRQPAPKWDDKTAVGGGYAGEGTSRPGELAAAAHITQLRELAPVDLLDREGELADLRAFCAGDEPYEWWQGPRGAGKTALAAWFALHPPPDVRVVSFFVIQRLAGESDSSGFTDSLFRQLAFLTDDPEAWSWPAEDRRRLLARLLEVASTRLAEHGERLLLVVDGLDEDQGGRPDGGPPSIAAILPALPPRGSTFW